MISSTLFHIIESWSRYKSWSVFWKLFVLLGVSVSQQRVQAQPSLTFLKSQLAHARTDTSRSRLLLILGKRYGTENPDSCFLFLHQSMRLSEQAHNAFGVARAMCELGQAYIYLLKDEARALTWLTKARSIASANQDYLHLAKCYQLLATIAFHQRMSNVWELMAIAARYARKTNNWEVLSDVYGASTDFSVADKNYRQAEKYCLKNLAVCSRHNPDKWLTAGLDYCTILELQGNTPKASAFARRLASVKGKLRQTDGTFVYTNDMARLSIKLRRYAEAEMYLLKGMALERKHGRPDSLHLSHYYKTLVDLFVEQKDFEKAYHYTNELTEVLLWLQKTRQTRDVKMQMTELKARLAMERNATELALLSARQQRQWLYLAGALLIAILLAGFVLVLQRKQQRIERQHTQLTLLNRTKDKLFAMLAHDLRSPFTSLSNNLTLLDWGALSPQEFARALPTVSIQLHNLQSTLDNLLNWSLSQLGGLRPHKKPVDINTVVASQIQLLQPIIERKYIRVSNLIPPDTLFLVDANHAAIIVRNLLQNAVKFTEPGGWVRFSYTQHEQLGRLSVSDSGIGIPESQLSQLFRLNSLPSRPGTASESGSGLGLVLVHELVQVNEGVMDVTSVPGQGTTFSLVLPVSAFELVLE